MNFEQELQAVLNTRIPLTLALGLKVESALPTVILSAPLACNLNHLDTAFGGSLYSLAVLAGWSWIWSKLYSQGIQGQIVIRHSEISYHDPIQADFRAVCEGAEPKTWEHALKLFQRRGMAGLSLEAWIHSGEKRGVHFKGDYGILR